MLGIIVAFFAAIALSSCVEVHFENKDGGFFLKHTARGPPLSSNSADGAPLSVDRFTVFQTARAVSVRASYGPFSTKQTVPARSLVPDPLAPAPGLKNNSLDQTPIRLDISAHVVSREIARDSPVIRVLFHTGGEAGGRVCGVVHASMGNRQPLTGACSPEGGEGACLAQLVVPASWWSALQAPTNRESKMAPPTKQPPRIVQLAYSVLEPRAADPDGGGCMPKVQIQPATHLGNVQLMESRAPLREIRADEILSLLVPRAPLYPLARFHIPVFVKHTSEHPVTYFVVKARVKSGLRLLGATSASDQWSVTVEIKSKVATITAVRRDFPEQQSFPRSEEVFSWAAEAGGAAGRGAARLSCTVRYARPPLPLLAEPSEPPLPPPHQARKLATRLDIDKDDIQAVLPISKNWEVLNTAVITGRQVSQAMKVLIVSQAGQVADVTLQSSCHSEDESVLKVSSSCSSVYVDGSEIRGSSNASVIVKYGTYTGLARFTVWMPELPLEVNVDDFRLSQIKGWKVPEESSVASNKIHGRGRRRRRSYGEDIGNSVASDKHSCRLRFQQSPVDVYARFLATDHDSGRVSYLVSRRTWLRVTELVLPLLRVADPRLAALRGRLLQGRATGRTEVQVLSPITGRVIGAREIRIGSDKVSISRLIVRVISGLQLNISPDNAIENGYISETTVTRKLTAQYQEGLLDIDIEFSDGSRTPLRDVAVDDYVLRVESLDPDVVAFAPMVASHHPRVIAVGEGNGDLLRIALLLSEECRGTVVNGKGRGVPGKNDGPAAGLILASASASVQVDFSSGDIQQRPDTPQNDDIMRSGNKGPLSDLHDILIGIPLKDENNHEPTVQARQLGGSGRRSQLRHSPHMTPVEIGMYVLLAAFCFAIVVFVVSCIVYASKFKPMGPESAVGNAPSMPLQPIGDTGKIQVAGLIGTTLGIGRDNRKSPRESSTNAHDWVWLGRATIEKHTGHPVHTVNKTGNQNCNGNNNVESANPNNSREIRITNNPLNQNYTDPDDAIKPDVENGNIITSTSFETHRVPEIPPHLNFDRRVRSSSSGNRVIDTTTYCKKEKTARNGRQFSNEHTRSWQPDRPPPLPPHGIPLDGRVTSSEEYRPPVPPHRTPHQLISNGVNKKALPETIMPPTRRHHSRHHAKSDQHQNNAQSSDISNVKRNPKEKQSDVVLTPVYKKYLGNINDSPSNGNEKLPSLKHISPLVDNINNLSKEECSGMFEFDVDIHSTEDASGFDEETNKTSEQRDQNKHKIKSNSPDLMKDSGIGPLSAGSSMEVKRATIVGNPMFSNDSSERVDDVPTESLGLDDLEMDYEQIMHYFHNLKESNA